MEQNNTQGRDNAVLSSTEVIGTLFNKFSYKDPKHLDSFIQGLATNPSLCLVVIKVAFENAHKTGIFSLEESEVLSKCIRTLLSSIAATNVTSDQPENSKI